MLKENIVSAENISLLKEEDIIERIKNGESDLFRFIMRRYNQRLYRIARSYGIDDDTCEDMLQQSYINAFEKLYQFSGKSKFSTWLIRILINEYLMHKRKTGIRRFVTDDVTSLLIMHQNPETSFMEKESSNILQSAIEELPEKYRIVYMMREVEELSINETAESLGITKINVKVRLHRAKLLMQKYLTKNLSKEDIYPFGNERCDRVIEKVMAYLGKQFIRK
jgi:RNA polymerase sigma-70 factor (ECF subfamily)